MRCGRGFSPGKATAACQFLAIVSRPAYALLGMPRLKDFWMASLVKYGNDDDAVFACVVKKRIRETME
jgi:hypothetical protein